MQRVLLFNFQGDPDTIYVGFEPQVFNDPINGHGLMVIAWRNDGQVDIYHQPAVTQAHKNYDIIGKGLADLVERPRAGRAGHARCWHRSPAAPTDHPRCRWPCCTISTLCAGQALRWRS